MIDFLITVLMTLGLSLLVWSVYTTIARKPFLETENEKKLKKSLEDRYIIDPESGTKLTLEEAESGVWLSHNNGFRTLSEKELDKIPTEGEKQAEIALNYLRKSTRFRTIEFKDIEIETLNSTKILTSYDDWSYSNSFKFENSYIFVPAPEIHSSKYYREDYIESHLMLWIKIDSINGHYVFREKSSFEKFSDSIRNDDEIQLKDYECFTIKKSHNIIIINSIMSKILPNKDLEIEIMDDNLFIKTLKLVCLEDVKRMETIINAFC
ncbi:MAG: hypothetical protein QNK89_07215 [Lacinutrix sp.]|uniref:hypothetical protein n=1 Tax=Lacinutrix sp. TaxID=1937692 RepID=UPI003099E5B6